LLAVRSPGTVPERRNVGMANEITNPVKAIRAFCLGCSGDSTAEVKNCHIEMCPLHPFRMGKNPYRQRREMSEEEKRVLANRLREARKNIGISAESEDTGDV
jgi:hypothetical protein